MDIASLAVGVLGLIVSLCGFTIAVWQIRRTRTAAESAEAAATEAREAVLRGISIPDLIEAQSIVGELLQLHRNQDLSDIFPKYEQLRAPSSLMSKLTCREITQMCSMKRLMC